MASVELTLIGKPGCHLCDDARTVISDVLYDLTADAASAAGQVTVTERSILDDSELNERFAEEIPVLLINGKVHTYWRVDPSRLRTAIRELQ